MTEYTGCIRLRLTSDGAPKRKRLVERATGIEPAFSAWEADVLPLNYAREQVGTLPREARRPPGRRVVSRRDPVRHLDPQGVGRRPHRHRTADGRRSTAVVRGPARRP